MSTFDVNRGIALVAIDLQEGILSLPLAPHSRGEVIDNTAKLAAKFHELDAPVAWVNVSYLPDGKVALHPPVDRPGGPPNLDPSWAALDPSLPIDANDVLVTKRQWGAFYGTDLDLQLRRRGITDVVLVGVATNMGVESTARDGWEQHYNVIIASDAISGLDAGDHEFAVTRILPKISRIRTTDEICGALDSLR